jgi:hypothetical protein
MPLEEDLLRLKELDRNVVRAVIETDFEALAAAVNEFLLLRKRLTTQMLEESVVTIADDDARATFQAISGEDGLSADGVIARLLGSSSSEGTLDGFDDHEIQKLGEDLFYSWFSHYEYVDGLSKLRPMLLRVGTSDAVSRLVGQARSCFAFQQYDAAYGLCRTVIEASVRDICVRRQLLTDLGPKVFPLENHNWATLRRKVSSGQLEERLKSLYAELSVLLHGRKSVTGEEARKAFQQTLEVVEELYAANEL